MRLIGSDLAKLFEDLRLVFGGNADAGVADRDLNRAVYLSGCDADPSAFGRELDSIRKQIEENLLDLPLVTDKITNPLVNLNIEMDAMPGHALTYKDPCIVDCEGEVEGSQLQFHPACLDLREIQNLVDQR